MNGIMKIDRLDHLVLTVAELAASLDFYGRVLGFREITFGAGRKALGFGRQKINLHEAARTFDPKARRPTPGSADLCFLTETPIEDVAAHVRACGVEIIEGPVRRTGARHPLASIYFRDPDGNLIEVANEIANEEAGPGSASPK